MIGIRCPGCGKLLGEAEGRNVKLRIKCPRCKRLVEMRVDEAGTEAKEKRGPSGRA